MKDTERETTTAELALWKTKQRKEAELTGQERLKTSKEKQENGYLNGGTFKLGKFK